MTRRGLSNRALTGALLMLAAVGAPAWAANECTIEYGYFTGAGPTRQDRTTSVTMNAGQTSNINRANLNFVRSSGNNKVDVTLSGAFKNNFTLDAGNRNPATGFYLTPTTLVRLFCTQGASAPAFGSPEQMISALKQANTSVNQIATQLKNTFNLTGQQIAALLRTAGYAANQVAAALTATFNATGAQVAGWLQAAGYAGEQVASALKAQFNATASQAAGWLKGAFNATGAQVAAWLKAAAYTGDQVAAALKAQFNATATQVATWLKGAFNATTQQLAGWLRSAGYTLVQVAQALDQLDLDPAQAMAAVKQAFNASWTEVVNAFKGLLDALRPTNCGAAGCIDGARLLQVAGASAAETLRALREAYNLSDDAAREIARTVFGLTGAALESAMTAAGYAAAAIGGAISRGVETAGRTIQNPSTAVIVIDCVTWTNRTCNAPDTRRPPRLEHLVSYDSNSLQFKIVGKNLQGINGISGLPARQVNVSTSFGQINVAASLNQTGANWSGPTSGRASLTINGQAVAGGEFDWSLTIDRTPPSAVAGGAFGRTTPASLQVTVDAATLYKLGTGTTVDAQGNNYVPLQNNAPHCQTVAAPNPPYATGGGQNSNRSTINVGPIGWQVRNSGSSAVTATVELMKGTQVMRSQTVTVPAGQTVALTPHSRTQNQTCVARLGADGLCYHCGQAHEGWNDNDVTARVRP